jgi:hypothetical protein
MRALYLSASRGGHDPPYRRQRPSPKTPQEIDAHIAERALAPGYEGLMPFIGQRIPAGHQHRQQLGLRGAGQVQPERACHEDREPGMGSWPPPITPTSGDGVVGSGERARDDDGGAPADQAGDAMDPGGLRRRRQAHRRQEGGRRRAGIDVHAPGGPRSRR